MTNREHLHPLCAWAGDAGLPVLFLGEGSNVVFPDGRLRALILRNRISGRHLLAGGEVDIGGAESLGATIDWLYESRMFFVDKLARMGARVTLCDPHRVLVEGPSRLRGIRLESPDIRAGMALLVAGLCARGTTVVEHSEVVHRGYERVVHRLSALGCVFRRCCPSCVSS